MGRTRCLSCIFGYARETIRPGRAVMHANVSVEYECWSLLKIHTFTHRTFSYESMPRLSTLLLSHDRIVCKEYLKSLAAVTLANRFPGVRTNLQSLSRTEISVTRNRGLLLLYHLLTRTLPQIAKKPVHVLSNLQILNPKPIIIPLVKNPKV